MKSLSNRTPNASAVAMSASPRSSALIAGEVVRMVMTYQMEARNTAMMTRRPI